MGCIRSTPDYYRIHGPLSINPDFKAFWQLLLSFHRCKLLHGEEEKRTMKRLMNFAVKLQILRDTRGQDLIEYALMAGFVAVAAGGGTPGGGARNIALFFQRGARFVVS